MSFQLSTKFHISFFNRKSQYRSDYEGIDTSQHHREPAVVPKDKQKLYVVPNQKMETVTVTQVDQNNSLD